MKKFLSALMAGAVLVAGLISANAATISELEARQAELEAQQSQYKAQLEKSNAAVSEQQSEVDAIVGQVESVTEEIQIGYQKIGILDKNIAEKQKAIDEKNAEIEGDMDVLRQRIKTIYISGDVSSLEIVLGAKDFSDFLDKLQLVQYVSNHDEQLINDVKVQLNAIADEKAALEADKEAKQKEMSDLEKKQEELNTLLEENKEVLASLQGDAEHAQKQLTLSEDQLSGLSAEIQEYYRQQREALAAAQSSSSSSSSGSSDSGSSGGDNTNTSDNSYSDPSAPSQISSGGGWVWPTPGNYYLTSEYGEARSYESHNAIDIGASTGTPIYAANSGTVVSSNNSCTHSNSGSNWCNCGGGYGNFVWILHDNGYETIYGHMISTTVYTGQTVSAGELIGYVGSTGWSTGPHLHFELRINGVKSNPMNLY
ncbi:MAG: peptidoglycan DD-metalloendopeptidase family protein [Ruminococcus sp.]|nr:peptidoglycan DD-metalloendopeptidase family protein [Ruminococcus sp.]